MSGTRFGAPMLGALFGALAAGGIAQVRPTGVAWRRPRSISDPKSHDRLTAAAVKRGNRNRLRLRNVARSAAGYHPVLQRYPGGARG